MKDNILKLNPVFSLFKPIKLIISILICSFFVFLTIIGDGILKASFLVPIALCVGYCYIFPSKIYLDRDNLQFIYYHDIQGVKSYTDPGRVRLDSVTKAMYSATRIRNLKFEQNFIEKIFNAGHFSFNCISTYEASGQYADRIKPKYVFTFYGISNFKQTKKEICNILGVNEI